MEKERLQKYIASSGFASRRKAEKIILEGRVAVNGKIVAKLGVKISPDDIVEIDGNIISPETKKVYIVLNKPIGYVTTSNDQFNRATVLDLIHDVKERVYPVGRLDYYTSGLLIITNDGNLAYALTHPSKNIKKVYVVEVSGMLNEEEIFHIKNGIVIDGVKTSPAELEILNENKKNTTLKIIIHEGRNREIRKMFEAINHPVLKLKRIEEGGLELGTLKSGEFRFLKPQEIKKLKSLCNVEE